MRLMAVISRPATASPRTNLAAPSMAPKKALSSSSSRRRRRGLGLVDQPGREVGVDRHLLAGHGVQGEPGRDLGDAAGALGDDDEVHDHQDGEDDHADDEVAAHQKLPKASMTWPAAAAPSCPCAGSGGSRRC